ncbi:phospholipase D-like domain-containing protein [Methylotenera sp. N17]|uniref:phospholipase D-like domain-containing protein n=1 Tax=Methylotenera sp. N17 TaxID=1502761 RepID=UPI000648CCF5|nr:phospholipase D-like domain-containing protein [Methylotenera sp. N17]
MMKPLTFLNACVWIAYMCCAGCVSVPDAPKMIQDAHAQTDTVEIQANNQTVSDKKAEKIIDNIATKTNTEDLLKKHLAIEQTIASSPLVAGNQVDLVFDGEQTFNAIYRAINNAKYQINLEYFIFENIQFKETDLKTLLIKKAAQGVQVCVIYDAFGSVTTPPELFKELKDHGVKIHEFHPFDIENVSKINQRDHRKILVSDGKLAIVGGVNLSSTYQSKSNLGMREKSITDVQQAHWKDTNMVIQGPAVAEVQKLFVAHWDSKQSIDQSHFYPVIDNKGKELVRVIGSAPTKGLPLYYATLVSAIQQAEKEIFLSSAYFVPTSDQKKMLIKAAKRGVDVNLLLPGVSDSAVAMRVQHSHYEDLLENNIHIFESDTEVLHAKTVTIDGVWSVVGSSNFDYRSAASNQEIDVVILGTDTATALKQKFNQDIQKVKRIDLATFRKRPLLEKVKEKFYRIFQQYL